MLYALVLLLTLGWAGVSQATVTASSANWTRNEVVGSSTPTCTVPSDVPSGATIILGIMDRTDLTTTISSIADPVNGTWAGATVRQGPSDPPSGSANRSWYAALTNSAALTGAGNRVITITMSASITTQVVCGWISSDLGALTFDAMATLSQFTGVTDWTADAGVSTAGAGVIVGFAAVAVNQNVASMTLGTGEAFLNTGTSNRTWAFYETYASSGSYNFDLTLGGAGTGNLHVGAFLEPGGAAVNFFPRRLQVQP